VNSLPGIDAIGAWLDANRPGDYRPGIIHGDFHFGNVMWRREEPKLAAIVDWELCTLGDPRIDLGNLLSTWPESDGEGSPLGGYDGFPKRAELIARYGERTGRGIGAIDWFEVLACYKIGIILEGTFARACAGNAPKETGDQLHASTLALLARARKKTGID